MITILFFFVLPPVLLAIVLARLKKYRYSANLVLFSILASAFWGGGWLGTVTADKLTPFLVFGIRKTIQEDIRVVGTHQRRISFSNGASIYYPGHFLVSISIMISLFLGLALIWSAARFAAFCLAKRFSPQLYDCLLRKMPPPEPDKQRQ